MFTRRIANSPPPPRLLARHVTTSAPAIRMLAEERKGLVVVELDKQLERKKLIREEEKLVERELFSKLLEEQREAIAKDAVRAAALSVQRTATTAMLRAQLADNEHKRIVAEEAKILEGELMVKAALRETERLAVVAGVKKSAARANAAATMQANDIFAARDRTRREEEARWERDLIEQQAAKDRAAVAKEAAERVEKEAREASFAKMRAAQKKVSDNRGAEDEARAVRAQETVELAARARAREEALRKEERKREVAEALALQVLVKKSRAEEEKLRDRQEVTDARTFAKELAMREEVIHVARRQLAVKAKHDLEDQKRASDVVRAQEIRRPLDERAATKLQEEAQRRVVENFRAEIVPKMRAEGVPASFVLNAKKVSNMLL